VLFILLQRDRTWISPPALNVIATLHPQKTINRKIYVIIVLRDKSSPETRSTIYVEIDKEVIELLLAPIKLLFAPIVLTIAMFNVMVKIVRLLFTPIFLLVGVLLKLVTGIMRLIVIPIAIALIVSFAVSAVRMLTKLCKRNKHHMKGMGCMWQDFSRKMRKPKKEAVKVEITDAEETKAEETKAEETKAEESKEQSTPMKASETTKESGSIKGGSTGAGT
jgi:hypothetical protein